MEVSSYLSACNCKFMGASIHLVQKIEFNYVRSVNIVLRITDLLINCESFYKMV